MFASRCIFLLICTTVWAQDAPPVKPASSPFSLGPVSVSGTLDGYFLDNRNDPGLGVNYLRNFDTRADQPTLSMAKISLDLPPAPIGFHIEAGAGKAFDIIESSAPRGGADGWKQILQAYVSVKPAGWKGLQVDFGKFLTWAGAEATESALNFNYSRSFLYAFGPYYHTGVRCTVPIGPKFTGGVQLVEGWNAYDGKNHGLTVGLTGTYIFNPKVTVGTNYYFGPEDVYGIKTYRTFSDSVLTYNPTSKTSFSGNFDYGQDEFPGPGTPRRYYGASFMARQQLTKKFAASARAEVYKDADGFWTGEERRLTEVTVTGEYKHSSNLITRVEYRRDSSDRPYFPKGSQNLPVGSQSTILVGVMLYLGPTR